MALTIKTCCCKKFFLNQKVFCNRILQGSLGYKAISTEVAQNAGPTEPVPSSITAEKILVPKRKTRTATSVLEALSSTVTKDFNSPHFKYIDDPYLIPTNNLEKRTFALAKASGQKAARYIVDRYPKNFAFSLAEPHIEAWMPTGAYQHDAASEAGLMERIGKRKSLDAQESYQKLREAGEEVPQGCLNQLLDLLCAYNGKDPGEAPLPDEQFFKREHGQDNTKMIRKSWNDVGPAETLFEQMAEKNTWAYNSLLRGRAKFFAVDQAIDLHNEMQDKNVPLNLGSYNALMSTTLIKERAEERWSMLQGFLGDMKKAGIQPNVHTFNNVLYCLSRGATFVQTQKWAMMLVNEMRRLGVEPSLTTWHYVTMIFYRYDESESNMLHDIVGHLEGKDFTLQSTTDLDFFCTAMAKCCNQIKDMELAHRVDALVNRGGNSIFVGDGTKESMYYTFFLRLLCMFEQIDTIMEHYERITPHAYTPTFSAMDDLLKAVELNDGYQYLPQIWSDMMLYDYTGRTDLIETILRTMGKKKQPPQLQTMYVDIAAGIKTKYEQDQQSRRFKTLKLTAPMVGDLVLINLNGGQFEKAWEFFELYQSERRKLEGFMSENSLVDLANACVETKDVDKLMPVLAVMADCAYPKLDDLVDTTKSKLSLTEEQINHIEDLMR